MPVVLSGGGLMWLFEIVLRNLGAAVFRHLGRGSRYSHKAVLGIQGVGADLLWVMERQGDEGAVGQGALGRPQRYFIWICDLGPAKVYI